MGHRWHRGVLSNSLNGPLNGKLQSKMRGYITTNPINPSLPPVNLTPEQALGIACMQNNVPRVHKLLQEVGINHIHGGVNQRFTGGSNPLSCAAEFGHVHLLKYLLKIEGIDINFSNVECPSGATALFMAVQHDRVNVVKILNRAAGIDINQRCGGGTVLAKACQVGYTQIVKILLTNDEIDVNKTRPIGVAITNGHTKIVKLLLANKTLDVNQTNDDGVTPLIQAVKLPNAGEMVKLILVRNDVDLNATTENGSSALLIACQRDVVDLHAIDLLLSKEDIDVNLAKTDEWGTSPLIAAIECTHVRVVKSLLNNKHIDVNQCRKIDGASPLLRAIASGGTKNGIAIVKLLLSSGNIDINQNQEGSNAPVINTELILQYNSTPLITAIRYGFTKVCRILIRHGASISQADCLGYTPQSVVSNLATEELDDKLKKIISGKGDTPVGFILSGKGDTPVGFLSNEDRKLASQDTNDMMKRHKERKARHLKNSQCMVCHVFASDLGVDKFKICPCKDSSAVYCGIECRKVHWKIHKRTCTHVVKVKIAK